MMAARLRRADGIWTPTTGSAERPLRRSHEPTTSAARAAMTGRRERHRPQPERSGPSLQRHVVLLPMVGRDRLDRDLPSGRGPKALERLASLRLEVLRGVRMGAHQGLLPDTFMQNGLHLAEDLGSQRRIGLYDAAALTGRARSAEERVQALPYPLPGHLDQPQLGDREHAGPRLVLGQHPPQCVEDLLAVIEPLHVDEVDDDDPAEITQPDLAD